MINSSKHQLTLSGWLKRHDLSSYETPLRLQKFILFYDLLSLNNGESIEFSSLKGYVRGPVYSNVWGDYTKERALFDQESELAYDQYGDSLDEIRVKKSNFMVKAMSEQELSDLTHRLNLWKTKQDRIMSGEKNVKLNICDYTSEDASIIEQIADLFPIEMIENKKVIPIDNRFFFVFSDEDAKALTEQQYDVLWQITQSGEVFNPIFAKIDESGAIVVEG